jgi:hypothetical protein
MARVWRALAVVSFGCVLAAMLVGIYEMKLRNEEASAGLRMPWDQPGRKYALVRRDERSAINSFGFNGRPFEVERTLERTRVLVLGDLVTFGPGVRPEEVYPRVAEGLLQERGWAVEIYNLAVYGYDVEEVAATLDHIAATLLDLEQDEARPVDVGTFGDPRLVVGSEAVSLASVRSSAMARRYFGAASARIQDERVRMLGDRDWFTTQLGAMRDDARAQDVPLLACGLTAHVLADPDPDTCGDRAGLPRFCQRQRESLHAMHDAAHALGLPFHSCVPYYQAAPEISFYPEGFDVPHHPDAAGHAVLAAGLVDLLEAWRAGELESTEPPKADHPRKQPRDRASGGKGSSGDH